jgi:hypothetical protein
MEDDEDSTVQMPIPNLRSPRAMRAWMEGIVELVNKVTEIEMCYHRALDTGKAVPASQYEIQIRRD